MNGKDITTLVVDLSSDTVTIPCQGMREAIAAADVGDDGYGEDPSVNRLQELAAEMLGKEAALFVPSGTMGNLLCVMAHCWGRGLEVLLGDRCYMFHYEQGNIAQYASVHSRTLVNKLDGTFCLKELRKKVRIDDPHEPQTALVCIENTHNLCGGKTLPMKWLEELASICQELNLPIHCDGARIFNAAVYLGIPVKDVVKHCDSLMFCLSKSLGAPKGAIIVGKREFIKRAHRLRKGLGGGLRQSGFMAAAGIFALERNVPKLVQDHLKVKELAQVLIDLGNDILEPEDIENSTNLLYLNINAKTVTPQEFIARLQKVTQQEKDTLGFSVIIKVKEFPGRRIRMVPHININREMMDKAKEKIKFVMLELQKNK